ncbi:predicted protein [Sclerotinia sclerotiorum 1980 UF-70]|uniref:Uncharacterized protein n=1 Tax=Sclerotinia sclerotiorum (strain ATCC 18683 / 1980 / Ss-1) TaxID=665079 RepID=A7F699_SCLS1|nr:predicted protein [Sclerotinia sclerotiorum 1980 UF-70]EDN98270.1 predicted protein [Sclerotinia sclerotiorum 1980 UF-70]
MNAGSLYPADNKIARDDQIPGRYLIYRIPLSFQEYDDDDDDEGCKDELMFLKGAYVRYVRYWHRLPVEI